MDLVLVILGLVLIGFLVWVLTTHVPMPPIWARAIQVIALVVVVLYLIRRFAGGMIPNVLN